MKEKETLKEILSNVDGSSNDYSKEEVFAIFHLCIMSDEIFDIAEYCESVAEDDEVCKFRSLTFRVFNSARIYAYALKGDIRATCSNIHHILKAYNNPFPTITETDLFRAEERWDIACNLADKEDCKYMKHVFLWMQSYIDVFKNRLPKNTIFSWISRLKRIVEGGEV